MEVLEENCFKINGEERSTSIRKTLSEKNWYTKSYAHFTDFISMEPPVFGCAALKASSGQMRVLSMFWKGKELDEGLAYFTIENNLYGPLRHGIRMLAF